MNMIIACVQCEADFELSEKEEEKYIRMEFDLPRRCPLCRKHKSGDRKFYEKRKHRNKKKHFRMKYEDDYHIDKKLRF